MFKHLTFIIVICTLFIPVFAMGQNPQQQNNLAIEQSFKQLQTGISVLYIAAHPDDENTQLLSYLSQVKHFRTGYLSLTRGDGGQNLIGAEQGIALGILRTHELLEARKIDGAEQFFSSAYDFGYSKSAEETFRQWDKNKLLADVVYVIRKFKPDVIVTRFDKDGSGGHGQHTASAILAYEAFTLAADSTQFPEQLSQVKIHQCKSIYNNSIANWLPSKTNLNALFSLEIGNYIPELGMNTGEIAAASRSKHLCQGFGTEKIRGEHTEYFKAIDGDTGTFKTNPFTAIDPLFNKIDPSKTLYKLLENAYQHWHSGELNMASKNLFETRNLLFRKGVQADDYPIQKIENLITQINGIYIESVYKNSVLPASGDSIALDFEINSRLSNSFVLSEIKYGNLTQRINPNQLLATNKTYAYHVPYMVNDIAYNNLFWMNQGIDKNRFTIKQNEVGETLAMTESIPTQWKLFYGADSLLIQQKIVQKEILPQQGEHYRALVVQPALVLSIPKKLTIARIGKKEIVEIGIEAHQNLNNIELKIQLPQGWKLLNTLEKIQLNKSEYKTVSLALMAQKNAMAGNLEVKAICNAETYQLQQENISYPHIGKQVYFQAASAKLYATDKLKQHKRILYINGAKEQVPSILKALGYQVDQFEAAQFAKIDLNKYDVLIFGIRSFNIMPQLLEQRAKYLSFVQNGGNVIVCYQTNTFNKQEDRLIGPYPFTVSKERTTDENAKVEFTQGSHNVLKKPYPITDSNFNHWVQERGIYYASNFDSAYQSLFQIADFNESPQNGALLTCKYGKGNFTYTGLSFFRQFPAAVKGAIELFVNLIEQ